MTGKSNRKKSVWHGGKVTTTQGWLVPLCRFKFNSVWTEGNDRKHIIPLNAMGTHLLEKTTTKQYRQLHERSAKVRSAMRKIQTSLRKPLDFASESVKQSQIAQAVGIAKTKQQKKTEKDLHTLKVILLQQSLPKTHYSITTPPPPHTHTHPLPPIADLHALISVPFKCRQNILKCWEYNCTFYILTMKPFSWTQKQIRLVRT